MTDDVDLTEKWGPAIRRLTQAITTRDAAAINAELSAMEWRDLAEGLCAAVVLLIETQAERDTTRHGDHLLHLIVIEAANRCHISPSDVISWDRTREAVAARRIASQAARLLGYTATAIGDYFGRNHTVISNYTQTIVNYPNEVKAARKIARRHGWRGGETAA